MIDQTLSGYGSLGNDLYAPFDPAFASDLPQREQDIEQAKSLLKAAGQEGLQIQLFTGDDIGSVAPSTASLFVEQAKKAGVDVKVVKKNPFYGDDYLSYPFAQDFWNTRNYLPQVSSSSLPSSPYNETHFNDPEFIDIVTRAGQEVDDNRRYELQRQAQEIEWNRGGFIIWGFRKQVDAYSNLTTGLKPHRYMPCDAFGFKNVSFVQEA